jgi:putative aldouronate transport system substrate-binding protein
MKKLSILLVSLLLVLALMVTACTPQEASPKPTDTPTKTDEPVKTEEPEPVVTLNWYISQMEPPNVESVMEEANKLIEEKINANVNLHFVDPGEYVTRITTMQGGGEEFDLVWTSNWLYDYNTNAIKGAFVELDDMINSRPALKDLVVEDFWNLLRVNGKIYSVPNLQVSFTREGMIFNKIFVDKYNIDINSIKSYDDLTAAMQIIKDNEPDIHPATHMYPWFSGGQFSWIGPDIYVDLDNWTVVGNECQIEFFEQSRKWNLAGFYPPDIATNQDFEPLKKAGKFFVQYTNVKPGNAEEASNRYGYELVDLATNDKFFGAGAALGTLTAISVTSKNIEKSMDMIELMATDKDVYRTIAFGLEGQDYNMVSGTQNTIEYVEGAYTNAPWMVGNTFLGFAQKGQPDNIHELTQEENRTAKLEPLAGFSFDQEPIATELMNIQAIQQEYSAIFTYGLADPHEMMVEYNEKMKAAGMEKVMEYIQEALDEWVKANK